ncbi:aminotransferase class I/II-fold pyridoxal phosphate-dependent enzyme [Colwellia sp. MB3u-28]|nr:aminotransferase class I/II-fold pyridoxal phosphate-dependent enzyme [Colwellia sp. MB02u-7]MBA6235542.1 aminotransferase class I/II-fold pyridoxal phosphate-dependent enzyme [Colwellia sp. MB02u-11]MBA6258096.1 aminotransferase class I/II-fold pyridoxal phosphate-dependent enzyme [Colwellia sp. MB3u-28]MBA6259790.1 aminotransferase class I/II-fold pyridoxal phosphate-dependent enzyme [Colwellia sp. MB3u-41]MBA6300266.1 aminotransferase class I/II-fold pyridoxal phosphate-dependent enzyme [
MPSSFTRKLPNVDTSIFTEMSMMANQHQAINLSQGFPEFDTPAFLKDKINQAINEGKNQYSPSNGLPDLLTQIAEMVHRQYQSHLTDEKKLNGLNNITITSGATEALWVAIQTLISPNDEVIIFDPAYDSYEPAIELAGGTCRHIALAAPSYAINWLLVEQTINTKTRAIIINSPHNPTGSILNASDLRTLQALVEKYDLYVISDEVYEHMTFDGLRHESVLRYPDLFKRAFVVSSFGKTFHCTGWKMGYCAAPAELTAEFRKIHQYVTFCSFTPAQIAIAQMLKEQPSHITALASFYQQKRDLLIKALKDSRFTLLPSKGTYFLLLDYSAISTLNDRDFCIWLTKEIGVAAIPLSPLYPAEHREAYHQEHKVIRLCFAKNDETLLKAAGILCQL